MKDNLITEIKRLNSIMGLSLIVEGIPGATANLFNKFFKTSDEASRVFQKIANDMDIADNAVDDIIKIMDDPSLYDNLSAAAKRDVFRLLSGVKGLSDELYDGVLKNFSIDTMDLTKRVKLLMVDIKLTYGEALNEVFKDTPEVVSLMRTKLRKTNEWINYKPDEKIIGKTVKYVGSRISDLGDYIFKLKNPLVSRNIKTVISILSQQKKGIELLKKEIDELFNQIISDEASLKQLRRDIENKLVTIERIADGGAEKALNEIDTAFKKLKKSGEISDSAYKAFLRDKKELTSSETGLFWNEFIAPNYKALDEQVDGLGSYFRNGVKAFTPLKLDWTIRKGRFGSVPKLSFNKEGIRRAFNFLAFNSAQTGADILKRLIKSNPPGKKGANVWIKQTYFRAIGNQLIIPFANAAFWTVWIPATEWFQQIADKTNLDVDWDEFETSFSELLAELWYDNLLDIWDKDPENNFQLELGDLRPVFKSRLVEIIKSFTANNDYKEPTDTTTDTTTVTTTGTTTGTTTTIDPTQSQYTLDGAKSVASEHAKTLLWQHPSDNNIYMVDNDADYLVTLEDGVYMVTLPDGKIKLSEY